MPLKVPKNDKIYTTVYDNFRGVDFTNDPSNIWSHRSPDAVNMFPDLSGRPWKRTGWEVAVTAQDFRDCYNTTMGYTDEDEEYYTDKIIPIKTNYFELGGEDYLAISNNLGLFFYSKFIGDTAKDEPALIYIKSYYGEIDTSTATTATVTNVAPDANRAFFFEGQGLSGFYIFCTTAGANNTIETNLFRFDGEVLRKVNAYVPTIMIGKLAGDTGGTIYEHPNVLTVKRICQFMGDGTSSTFVLPEKADSNTSLKVEVLSSGVWVQKSASTYTVTYSYSFAGTQVTKITFTSDNIPANSDIDNVRITYSIKGDVSTTNAVSLTPKYISVKTQTKQTRTITYVDDKISSTTPWANGDTTTTKTPAEWVAPNIIVHNGEPQCSVYLQTSANTWSVSPALESIINKSYTAYSNILKVDVTNLSSYYYNESTTATTPTELSSNASYGDAIEVEESHVTINAGETEIIGSYAPRVRTVRQQRFVITTKNYPIKVEVSQRVYSSTNERNAFEQCQRAIVYGDGIINSVFMSGSTATNYRSRVWWSAPSDPSYFPDVNYVEAGSNDTRIAGMMKVGEYLGIIKQGQSYDSTIYLAYPTKVASGSITDVNGNTETVYDDTFAIKSSIGGIGAVSNGAFNILNDEPLFLSKNGIMGINPANENEKQLRNRSFFINKRLAEEGSLENAFSFVWRNMYILAINDHCYVLDGSQKNSWANEKTNLQYECYYWENIPAQCFARYNDELWFTDRRGRLCRFKPEFTPSSYHDDYDPNRIVDDDTSTDIVPISVLCSSPDVKVTVNAATFWTQISTTGQYVFTFGSAGYLHRTMLGHDFGNSGHLDANSSPRSGDSIKPYLHNTEGWHLNGEPASLTSYGITIEEGSPLTNDTIAVFVGNPIMARWSTALDDDGAMNYFKTLQKKGTMVSLFPNSSTGVRVYIRKDNKEEQYVGTATVMGSGNSKDAPSDFYLKKKAKKYKRLQIIAENDGFDENFGINQIIKCYTLGSYSRNR